MGDHMTNTPFSKPAIDPLDAWKPIKVGEGCYIIDGPGDELIARLEVFVGGSEDDNDRAARVMAAAPLLLRELRRLVTAAGMGAAADLDGAKAVIASCDGTSGRGQVNTTGPERGLSEEGCHRAVSCQRLLHEGGLRART